MAESSSSVIVGYVVLLFLMSACDRGGGLLYWFLKWG